MFRTRRQGNKDPEVLGPRERRVHPQIQPGTTRTSGSERIHAWNRRFVGIEIASLSRRGTPAFISMACWHCSLRVTHRYEEWTFLRRCAALRPGKTIIAPSVHRHGGQGIGCGIMAGKRPKTQANAKRGLTPGCQRSSSAALDPFRCAMPPRAGIPAWRRCPGRK